MFQVPQSQDTQALYPYPIPPTGHIYHKHDGVNAKNVQPEDAGGLEPAVVLAKGAKVMVTRNLWQAKGYIFLLALRCI